MVNGLIWWVFVAKNDGLSNLNAKSWDLKLRYNIFSENGKWRPWNLPMYPKRVDGKPSTLLGIFYVAYPSYLKYATVCDSMRRKYLAVNPRYPTFCFKSYTVNIRYTTCRICDSMRYVVLCRGITVVLQVSNFISYSYWQ